MFEKLYTNNAGLMSFFFFQHEMSSVKDNKKRIKFVCTPQKRKEKKNMNT